jgi:hypothetical protein
MKASANQQGGQLQVNNEQVPMYWLAQQQSTEASGNRAPSLRSTHCPLMWETMQVDKLESVIHGLS